MLWEGLKKKERCFHFNALVRNFHEISRLSNHLHAFLTLTKNNEVRFERIFAFGKKDVKNIFRLKPEKNKKASFCFDVLIKKTCN